MRLARNVDLHWAFSRIRKHALILDEEGADVPCLLGLNRNEVREEKIVAI